MGADIEIYAEGFCSEYPDEEKRWVNIDHWRRDLGPFPDLQWGARGGFTHIPITESRNSFCYFLLCGLGARRFSGLADMGFACTPVSQPRGLPVDRDTLAVSLEEFPPGREPDSTFYHPSWLTLGELRRSGYAEPVPMRGWITPREYDSIQKHLAEGVIFHSFYTPTQNMRPEEAAAKGYVHREWRGYLSTLFAHITGELDKRRRERGIKDEEHARILFWFDV